MIFLSFSVYLLGDEVSVDTMWFDVADEVNCHIVDIEVEDKITITENNVREIPLVVTNNGARGANYVVSIDQGYDDWMLLPSENPVFINNGETKTITLTAFPGELEEDKYEVTVTLTTKGVSYFLSFEKCFEGLVG